MLVVYSSFHVGCPRESAHAQKIKKGARTCGFFWTTSLKTASCDHCLSIVTDNIS